MRHFFNNFSRQSKRLIIIILDAVLLPVAFWLAIAIKLGEWSPRLNDGVVNMLLLIPIVAIPMFIKLGLYRAITRYVGEQVLVTVINGVTVLVLVLVSADYFLEKTEIPRSSFVIFWGVAVLYIAGSRLLVGAYFRKTNRTEYLNIIPVAIYGAGETGVKLSAALQAGKHFRVMAFIDDSLDLQGTEIFGVRVYPFSSFAKVLKQFKIVSVLLAIPSASRIRRSEIIRAIGQYKVPIKTIPNMIDLMNGLAKVDEIREVELEDLLGRDTVQPIAQLLKQCIEGKSVMVTGAGGGGRF